ncbi:DEAD/DEAH box RNA helicase [Thraustotheca clavata]|uniref:RNA helicase n=1 Tax=Thraustotheca clavata TaxID=74557 RepID=A0A1V9YSH1_9STRA|nr:DEAD/DEAH box RNA helicase [Thraustotheca clavata]
MTDEDKKLAKKLRKEKKRKEKEVAAAQEEVVEVESKKKKKKDKKRKAEKHDEESVEKKTKADFTNGPYQQPAPSDKSFKKSFYVESDKTASLSNQDVDAFHQEHHMTISGNNCLYRPILKFADVNFPKAMLKSCENFTKPTPIQSQCWPILTSGRDIIGIAQTGSGKTLAFSVPGLVHITDQLKNNPKKKGPIMLVVAPTRELAVQCAEVISEAGKSVNITSLCLYGGVPKHEQKRALKAGVQVVVATPGRLKDLVQEKCCSLANVTYTVLDEADRMLDDGFEKDIRLIMSECHVERQIAMFSATWPQSIQKLAHEFLVDPVKVTIGSDDLAASENVTQIVEVVDEYGRDSKLDSLLKKYHSSRKNRVLVFVLYKKEAVRVETMLNRKGWKCTAIHGDKGQQQRMEALEAFKTGKVPLLIATDVAARGLDIPDVEFVLNYSFPLTIEDYVHRIGRTGRGGKKGTSHTFFTNHDKPKAGELVNLLRDSNAPVPEELTKFGTHVKKKEHKLYGAFAKDVDMNKKATKITFDSDDE